MYNIRHGKLRPREGAVVVEFALLLPILLLFFAAMIEISRALLLQHTVDSAAYEGARSAMVPGADAEDAVKAAMELLDSAKLKHGKITVEPTEITELTPVISVTVEVPLTANCWTTPLWFKKEKIRSEVTLICERPPMVQLTGLPMLQQKGLVSQLLDTAL